MKETIQDYVRWRGDLTFDVLPFCDIDNIVLSELSYLDLKPAMEETDVDGKTLHEVFEILDYKHEIHLLTVDGGYEDFLRLCAHSQRYGDLIIEHHVDVTNPAENIQFSVTQYRINRRYSYIAFRGTDNTIVGWKEDFMMSFATVPSQRMAVDYLNRNMERLHRYYVGGHSKGGALALYACAFQPANRRKQIERIYMNDAPGMCADVVDLDRMGAVLPMIQSTIPEYEVVGRLFEPEIPNRTIVRSTGKGIAQHDLMTWRLDGPKLVETDRTDPASDFVSDVFNQWIYQVSYEERVAFVNELFAALSANGAHYLDEIWSMGIDKVLAAILKSSKTAQRVALDLPQRAMEELQKNIESAIRNPRLIKAGKHE